MSEALILLTGLAIVLITFAGLSRTRDPLFPLTILAPMLLYVYVYAPLVRVSSGALQPLFPDQEDLTPVHVLNLLAVTAFCVGCIWRCRPPKVNNRFGILLQPVPRGTRRRMQALAIALGLISCGAFAFIIQYSGGWTKVFSHAKPFLRSPTGYVGEMPMLSYPAIFILAFAYQGRRVTIGRWLAMLGVMLPQIIMATLGGRRGPMFLVVCSYLGAWCIIHRRRPRIRSVIGGLTVVGCLMLLLQGNRGNLFRPWKGEIETKYIEQLWSVPDLTYGDEYVVACATVLVSSEYAHHYWGSRYFATFIVRPIPSFLWPSKYKDMGLGWMQTDPGKSGIPTSQWYESVGFEPAGGAAGGFVADLFLEFSWGCIIVCFLLGMIFSTIWKRWVTRGQLWTLLYFEVMILSVYLISQSLGAWLYRLILVGALTLIFWRTSVPKLSPIRAVGRSDIPRRPMNYGHRQLIEAESKGSP